MKLALVCTGLFVALLGLGIACGPKETFCYQEGRTCAEEKARRDQEQKEGEVSDAGEVSSGHCFDNSGKEIPCG